MAPAIASDGTITFSLTLPWADLSSAYREALTHAAATAEIKGFRKGKAPLDLVEKAMGKAKLYQEAFAQVFITAYNQVIANNHLHPLISPQVKTVTSQEGQDWQIEVTTAQAPQISLTGYQDALKTALAKDKIWLPAKGSPKVSPEEKSHDKRLSLVFDALLSHIELTVSPVLVDQEKHQALTRLLDQVNHLGLTIDQYLTSKGITSDQLQQEYAVTATTNLKLEFILQAIATDLKISPTDEDINQVINQAPAEAQDKLNTNKERAYITAILRKRLTLDALLRL